MAHRCFEIEKVDADIGFDEFHKCYFEPELPVVVEGIGKRLQRSHELTLDNIRGKILEKGLAKVNTFWFEGPVDMADLLVDTPAIVAGELEDSHCRKTPCRLWVNAAGNLTPSHYDGNLLYVFNLQLKGRKEWRIVSPHTPLANYPFSRAALHSSIGEQEPRQKDLEYCDFTLEEGDMVYLPPLWHHTVRAAAEQNINVNWVATRRHGFVQSKTLQRELEVLKFGQLCYKLTGRTEWLDVILGAGVKNYMENYAGVGWDFISKQTAGIKRRQVFSRILKESTRLGHAVKDSRKLRDNLKKTPLDSFKKPKSLM